MSHTTENQKSTGLRHGQGSPAHEAGAANQPAARCGQPAREVPLLDRLADGTPEEQIEFVRVFFRHLGALNKQAMQ